MENPANEALNGELVQLATLYDGRIIIIDKNFTVIKDTYELEESAPEQLAEGYWESIQTFVSQQSKVCAGVISDAEWKIIDGKMQIFVKNNMAYYLSQKHLDDAIMKMIETETGQRLLVQFKMYRPLQKREPFWNSSRNRNCKN